MQRTLFERAIVDVEAHGEGSTDASTTIQEARRRLADMKLSVDEAMRLMPPSTMEWVKEEMKRCTGADGRPADGTKDSVGECQSLTDSAPAPTLTAEPVATSTKGPQQHPVERFVSALMTTVPGVTTKIDEPARLDGHWFVNVKHDGHEVVVEWRAKHGFGVTSTAAEPVFGEGPEEILKDSDAAVERVAELLRKKGRTRPGQADCGVERKRTVRVSFLSFLFEAFLFALGAWIGRRRFVYCILVGVDHGVSDRAYYERHGEWKPRHDLQQMSAALTEVVADVARRKRSSDE